MAENQGSLGNPENQMIARFEELSNQCAASQDQADEFLEALDDLTDEAASVGMKGFETGGELQKRTTDFSWIMALRGIVPPAIILKVWNKKDEMAREGKDPTKNPAH